MPLASVQRFVFAGFVSAASLVVALAAVTWNVTRQTLQASNFVSHTFEVISALGTAEAALYRADSAQRAWLLDAKPLFLRDRDAAFGELRLRMDEIASLTLDNPRQQRRIESVRNALAELDGVYRAARTADALAATEPMFARLKPVLAALTAEERALLQDRERREADRTTAAETAFGALVLLLFLLMPLLFWRIRRDLTARLRAEQAVTEQRRYDAAHASALTLYNAKTERQAVLDGTLALLGENPLFPVSAYYEREPLGGRLRCLATRGAPVDLPRQFDGDDGALGVAARTGEAVYLGGLDAEGGMQIETGLARLRPAALLLRPVAHQGEVLGVLVLACAAPLGEREREFVDRLAGQLGVALNNLRQTDNLNLLAERLRESSADIQAKNEELQRANRMKSEFVANMSHELRTPLNAVLGFAEILRDGLAGPLSAEQVEHVTSIYDSGRHLLALINDILDLSKVEAGQMALEPTAVDLSDLLGSGLAVVRERATLRHIELEARCEPGARVEADPRRVKQIIYNLLSNAVKFTPDGGSVSLSLTRVPQARLDAFESHAESRLFLPATRHAEWLEIAVTDTGIGLDPAGLQQLFQAFVQIDSSLSRRFEGTGLGLTMVQRLAELHGGGLAVQSRAGAGSTFIVWLPWRDGAPLAQPELPALAPPPPVPADAPAAVAGLAPLILMIEDDGRAAQLMRLQLEASGYRTELASTAEQGLLRAREAAPDAVILDVVLPGMDGWDLLARLKEHAATRHIPVVLVSITDEPRRGFALGAAQVLVKPVSQEELLAGVAAAGLHPGAPGGDVLVVDDDPKAVSLVCTHLQAAGYTPRPAYGGQQALELAQARRPDLIVLDLMMPNVSGFDVLDELGRGGLTAGIPVLVLSAKLITERDRELLRGRVQRVIEKADFSPEAVIAEVRRAMARRAMAA